MPKRALAVGIFLTIGLTAAARAASADGYQPRVTVAAPTRLDWTFALSNPESAPIRLPTG